MHTSRDLGSRFVIIGAGLAAVALLAACSATAPDGAFTARGEATPAPASASSEARDASASSSPGSADGASASHGASAADASAAASAAPSVAASASAPQAAPVCPAPLPPAPLPRALTLDAIAAPDATPELATRAVRPDLDEAFPAVSEDGSTLVELALDQEDFSGRSVQRIRFFSLPSGRVSATFTLHDQPADDAAKTPKARADRLRVIERDWTAAQERLGRSKWVSLEHGEPDTSECPPWAALDRQVGQSSALRFERADMEVALDVDDAGAVKALVVRRAVAGRVVTTRAHVAFPAAGRLFGGGACGMIQGLADAFVTPDGATLFLRPAVDLGGDACAGTLRLDRVTIIRTPK